MPARRKPEGPSRVRTVRFTDDEWAVIVERSMREQKKPATYLRDKSLERAQRSCGKVPAQIPYGSCASIA